MPLRNRALGTSFSGFLVIVLVVCIWTYVVQHDHLKTEHHFESLVSRESSFMFNNLLLLMAAFTILFGTLFPVIREAIVGDKATVGGPYYKLVEIPIGILLVFLTGVGPLLGVAFDVAQEHPQELCVAADCFLGDGDCFDSGDHQGG